MTDLNITMALTVAIAGLALLAPEPRPTPIPAAQAAVVEACECNSIECQVCPAEGFFSTKDRAWCEARGWSYEWTSAGWKPNNG